MTGWNEFIGYGAASVALWGLGAGLTLLRSRGTETRNAETGNAESRDAETRDAESRDAESRGATPPEGGRTEVRTKGCSEIRAANPSGNPAGDRTANRSGDPVGNRTSGADPARSGRPWNRQELTGNALFLTGTLVFGLFIVLFWLSAGRAPMRTMGETRLWYALFIAATGWVLHVRWRYRFLLPFAGVLAAVFTLINILRPEIHSATLMPALQSAWFIPHVAVYMLAYAVTAAALAVAAASFFGRPELLADADRLVRIGAALMLLGMLSGAVWARQAWGKLLGLGCQGELGRGDVAAGTRLHPLQAALPDPAQNGRRTAPGDIPRPADHLVRSELPAFGKKKPAHLYDGTIKSLFLFRNPIKTSIA